MACHDVNRMPAAGIVLYGGTGQAKILRPIVEHYGGNIVAVCDDTPGLSSPFSDVPILRGYGALLAHLGDRDRARLGFLVAIGNPHGRVRIRLHDQLVRDGFVPVTVVHPTAFVERDAIIGAGSQVLAGALVLAEARIGRQCIVNTKASVDHECVLEDGCEIAPGATLCGLVHAEVGAWVCAGATVLPRRRIGADAIVGAGALVTRDVAPNTTVVGIPARPRES